MAVKLEHLVKNTIYNITFGAGGGNFQYLGCAQLQIVIGKEDERFGPEYELKDFPRDDRNLQSAIANIQQAIEDHPCRGPLENTAYVFFFRDPAQPDEPVNIVHSFSPEIYQSNTDIYTIYNVQGAGYAPITLDEFRCDWEKAEHTRAAMLAVLQEATGLFWHTEQVSNLGTTNNTILRGSLGGGLKSGTLTSVVVGTNPDKTPIVGKKVNCDIVSVWYDVATHVSTQLMMPEDYWCFYRTMLNPQVLQGDSFIQPVPCSSTYDLNFANQWLKGDTCCVLKVLVPNGSPITVLEPPGHEIYDGRNSQYEVVLPAGICRRIGEIRNLNGVTVADYVLEPWNKNQCLDYINSNNITRAPLCYPGTVKSITF
jgi:hypothetical protein